MQALFTKLWSNEFYKGSFILTLSSFLVNAINYFSNLLIGRALGPTGFGEITTLFSYIAIISTPIAVISTIITQRIGSSDQNKFSYTKSIEKFFWSKIRRWWFFLILIFLSAPFIPNITNLSIISAYTLPFLLVLGFISSFYAASLQGLSLFTLMAIVGIIGVTLKLVGALSIYYTTQSVGLLLMFIIGAQVVVFGLSKLFLERSIPANTGTIARITDKNIRSIIFNPQVYITTISILAISLFSNIDIIFVKKFFSATDAGIYSAWSLFAKLILYVIGPLASVGLVYFAKNKNAEEQNSTLLLSLGALMGIGIASYGVYTYFSSFVIQLFFGNSFSSLSPYLWYASIFGSLYAAISLLNNYFLAKRSVYALVLPASLIFYIIGIILVERRLESIMQLNIVTGVVTVGVYLYFYYRTQTATK